MGALSLLDGSIELWIDGSIELWIDGSIELA